MLHLQPVDEANPNLVFFLKHHRNDFDIPICLQEFYREFLNDKTWVSERKRELKIKAGLAPQDTKVSWCNLICD